MTCDCTLKKNIQEKHLNDLTFTEDISLRKLEIEEYIHKVIKYVKPEANPRKSPERALELIRKWSKFSYIKNQHAKAQKHPYTTRKTNREYNKKHINNSS